jgi:hypothetical protein
MEKFKAGMQTAHTGEMISTDPDRNWMCRVDYICRDVLGASSAIPGD